jgi:hypothetical protein
MITLPVDFITNLISTMSLTASDILPFALFVSGIIFGVYIISGLLHKNKDN